MLLSHYVEEHVIQTVLFSFCHFTVQPGLLGQLFQ